MLDRDRAPLLRVLHRVVDEVRDRAHHLPAVARHERTGDPGVHLQVDARRRRRRAQLIDRVVDEHFERHRRARRRFLGLDEAEVEQVVDDARQPLGLLDDAFGERSRDGGIVFGHQRLGQHLERADRRLELVAHVGHEVAPHALDPVHLRHVVDERGDARAARSASPIGTADRWTTARGGLSSCSSRSQRSPLSAARSSASSAPATTASA